MRCKKLLHVPVIAISQAGIAAPTLPVMQDFEAKKNCSVHILSRSCVYTPLTFIPRIQTSDANRTRVRWLEPSAVTTTLCSLQHFADKMSYLNQRYEKGNDSIRKEKNTTNVPFAKSLRLII